MDIESQDTTGGGIDGKHIFSDFSQDLEGTDSGDFDAFLTSLSSDKAQTAPWDEIPVPLEPTGDPVFDQLTAELGAAAGNNIFDNDFDAANWGGGDQEDASNPFRLSEGSDTTDAIIAQALAAGSERLSGEFDFEIKDEGRGAGENGLHGEGEESKDDAFNMDDNDAFNPFDKKEVDVKSELKHDNGVKIDDDVKKNDDNKNDNGKNVDDDEEYDPFDTSKKPKPSEKIEDKSQTKSSKKKKDSDDFDPRADIPEEYWTTPAKDTVTRARPRPAAAKQGNEDNPFKISLREAEKAAEEAADPFTATQTEEEFPSDGGFNFGVFSAANLASGRENISNDDSGFNPFATITGEDTSAMIDDILKDGKDGGGFDPFQTIHDDDAFQPDEGMEGDPDAPFRINPFDKEPPLPEKFASLEPQVRSSEGRAAAEQFTPEESEEEEEEELEPIEDFLPEWDFSKGWKMLLRQPFKKKLTQNRFWKPAFVKVIFVNDAPYIRIFSNEQESEVLHELLLQSTYSLCEMELQQMDQFGKCHTVKIQQVNYVESVGVKADRIAPTISDLTRVRDLKGLKDLVHKPKATMLLSHAAQATEVLKFGSMEYDGFKSFIYAIEDVLFKMKPRRVDKPITYTKDEITVTVQDEYCADIDTAGRIVKHKARVRLFCLAFLSGCPTIEIGINDKKRRGKEIVGRRDIIPIKTEEWISIQDYQLDHLIDEQEFQKTKVVKLQPLDACRFELMRFRVRPRINVELPLQIRVQQCMIDKHIEIRIEVMVTGYYSNSRRANQSPCEGIQIRIPIPEPWWYLFRVEKRFRYGAVHSTTRKAGKIKGLERLTMFAQGALPPSLIEVSAGRAKFENVFSAVVWRIDQLPERNEGAYKTHMLTLNIDLQSHDKMPEDLEKFIRVEYSVSNSTVSHAQVRSIAVSGGDEPPDRWVHHLAKYEYNVEIEFTDKAKPVAEDFGLGDLSAAGGASIVPPAPKATHEDEEGAAEAEEEEDSDSSDSD